jgi:prolyl-tRNA editing enzyme YbaK/EbsC (Cys-tRNA(Pro) deacylase)
MVLGGVTPIGLPESLPPWVDAAVMARESVVLGGGDRATKIRVPPRLFELLPGVDIVEGLALPRG